MKKVLKNLFRLILSFISIFAFTIPTYAISFSGSNIDAANIIKNSDATLGYIMGDGYDNTYDEHLESTSNQNGSINIFGKMDANTWYETSLIKDPLGGTEYKLSGIFPVYVVGNDKSDTNYKYLTYDSDKKVLSGNYEGVEVTVTSEFVYGGKFIKLTFNITSSSEKTVSFGAYNDLYLNGNKYFGPEGVNGIMSNLISGTNNYGIQLPIVPIDGTNRGISFLLKNIGNFGINDVDNYWFGNRDSSIDPKYTEYSNVFTKNVTVYDETKGTTPKTGNDTAMSFSWVDESIAAGGTLTKSVLIGVGPAVTVTGNSTYNLDDSKDTIVNGGLLDPSLQTGKSNQLWYSINGGTAEKLGDLKTDKYTDYTLNIKDEAELNKCGDNNIKVWVGDQSDPLKVISNVAEHNFRVTSSACEAEQKQTGINLSYVIITTIICGGIVAFVYSKKHTKFPQV